jgi:hypothetical protein
MKACGVSRSVAGLPLNLGGRWKSVVNFMPSLFSPGKELQYKLNRMLSDPRAIPDFLENGKIFFP